MVKENNKKVQSSLKTIKGGKISKIGKGYKADQKSSCQENKKVISDYFKKRKEENKDKMGGETTKEKILTQKVTGDRKTKM